MKGFAKTSIGKKLFMSISGLFLITFLLVHLSVNMTLFLGKEAYNQAVEFMDTNPMIQIMQPLLALGFLLHISYSFVISIQNRKARGVERYAVVDNNNSSWASRNMLALGIFVFAFITVHLIDFFLPMKTTHVADAYELVVSRFDLWYVAACYLIGFIALGFHLHHAFWSAFQTLGLSNELWRKRLARMGDIVAILLPTGFACINLYFFIF